ncbi:DUF1194 domain-containing protein [Salinarimonas soli]|uniref:DUF1194 domain-containing protein n=1 Tax=Salinarimonas soli TaxID=1638099 RepID=A0A5B2VAD5_9HYPH|nr:DUF1194 domain-containing protein [Salinarimonas soli]KAA2235971.1 DUF1194 domain-containing protein [Salinarimonas soli]
MLPRLAACALLGLALHAAPARAETEVDVALVLAVDISYSMDQDEQVLQRQGFIDALRSPLVHDAIRRGMLGRIAVVYAEWAGTWDQRVVVPWSVIDGPEAAMAFADKLMEEPTRRATRTSISGAIDMGVGLLRDSGMTAMRQVIDISGDGPNNQGRPVTEARDEAVAQGITINGLPIMLKQPGYLDIADLDAYFRACVIGGVGAFVVPARDKGQFPEAIKTKIVMEVSGLTPPEPLIRFAAAPSPPDCRSGESQWRGGSGN